MTAETTTGTTALGPYETEHQARNAPLGVEVRELHDSGRTLHGDSDGLVAATKLRHLTEACTAAGIDLGTYDWRILRWLTTWEPSTIQVVIGLIARAAGGGELDRLEATVRRLNRRDQGNTAGLALAHRRQAEHLERAESAEAEVERLCAERTELNGAVINEINATNAAMAEVERLRAELQRARDDAAALTAYCAICSAAPGEVCRTSIGERTNWHALRLDAAGRTRNAARLGGGHDGC